MKYFAIFLFALAGVVAAQQQPISDHHEVLDAAADDVVAAFAQGLDEVPTPEGTLSEETEKAKAALVKTLQDALQRTVEKFKERIDHGHTRVADLIEKVHDLTQRLKAHHADLGQRVRDAVGRVKGTAKQHLEDIFKGFARDSINQAFPLHRDRRSIRDVINVHLQEDLAAEKLCSAFLHMVPEAKKENVGTICKTHVKDFVKMLNKVLAHGNTRSKRAAGEISSAIRDFFQEIKINYQEKYADLAEWLKQTFKNGLEKAGDRHEKLMEIARQAKEKVTHMKKQAVEETLDALRPYKTELGSVWTDLVDAAKNTFKKHE